MPVAECIKLICFLDIPRRICHGKVAFLIIQRTVKCPHEQGLCILHLVHEKKQILTYKVSVTQVIAIGNSKRYDIQAAQQI